MYSPFRCEFRAPCRYLDAPRLLGAQPADQTTVPEHRADVRCAGSPVPAVGTYAVTVTPPNIQTSMPLVH